MRLTSASFVAFVLLASAARAEDVTAIGDAHAIAALCASLEPTERVQFQGDPVDRAEAERAHDRARDVALEGRYAVVLSGASLAFSEYDRDDRALELSRETTFSALGGALRLWPGRQAALAVKVDPPAARRVFEAQRRGELALRVVFDLDEDAPCVALHGGLRYSLTVDPVRWEYLARGQVLARGGSGQAAPPSVANGARPAVKLASSDVVGASPDASDRVVARRSELGACYSDALKRNPALDGSLYLEIVLSRAEGPPEKVNVVADTLLDEGLRECVRKVVGQVPFRRARVANGKATIPLEFVLEAPRG
jgi:hypothetical protein